MTAPVAPVETPQSREVAARRRENQIQIAATQQSLDHVDDVYIRLSASSHSPAEILSSIQALPEFAVLLDHVRNALQTDHPQLALQRNPYHLLRIRNYDGLNLIEQLRGHLIQKLDQYQAIDQLLDLEHYTLTTMGSHNLPPSERVKTTALDKFNALSPTAKNAFCRRIWELCGSPQKDNFGEQYIREKRDIRLFHICKGGKTTQTVIQQLKNTALNPPVFNTMYVYPQEIKVNDSDAIRTDMRIFYQIQDFNNFLHDPEKIKDRYFMSMKFRQLDMDVREALCKLAWIGSYRPDEHDFGGKFIKRDFNVLLQMQDLSGKPILEQMLEHYQVKIEAQRKLEKLEPFVRASQRVPALSNQALYHEFEKIEEPIKARLRHELWLESGGRINPKFGGPGWARKEIIRNPRCVLPLIQPELSLLQEKAHYTLNRGVDQFDAEMAIPEGYVVNTIEDILHDPEIMASAPAQIQVAMATAEFAGVISVGGLAGAAQGIAKGVGERNVHVIMPKFDTLPEAVKSKLTPVRKYQIKLADKTHRVFEAVHNDTHFYFIEDDANFTVGFREGKPLNIYEYANGKRITDTGQKRRWAVFQSLAAELIYKLSKEEENPVNVVHVHDAQTALIPAILKARHHREWLQGESPATVFTFHNNLSQQSYDYKPVSSQLEEIGLPRTVHNSFIQGLEDADAVTTVSLQFSKEAQTAQFGKKAEQHVKAAAYHGKLYGIVNGNTNAWDPATNPTLKSWKTLDGTPVNLSYGPETPDLRDKLIFARKELAVHLAHHELATIDPTKPIIFFIGRYDHQQKGIDKLPKIMEEALAQGAQFICIGTNADPNAARVLRKMQERATELGNNGVLVLEDYPDSDGRLHYQMGLGLGPLMRAAIDVGCFPSSYEPCGLVQGEGFRFGKRTIATDTGGFHDTIITEGPKKNGYLFKRHEKWHSPEQDQAISVALTEAIEDARTTLTALYFGSDDEAEEHLAPMRSLMRDAIQSTWTEAPDGSDDIPAIYQYDLIYAKALKDRTKRRTNLLPIRAHLLTL